jgi:hypothetical protein
MRTSWNGIRSPASAEPAGVDNHTGNPYLGVDLERSNRAIRIWVRQPVAAPARSGAVDLFVRFEESVVESARLLARVLAS